MWCIVVEGKGLNGGHFSVYLSMDAEDVGSGDVDSFGEAVGYVLLVCLVVAVVVE